MSIPQFASFSPCRHRHISHLGIHVLNRHSFCSVYNHSIWARLRNPTEPLICTLYSPLPSSTLGILYCGVTGIYALWCHASFASVTCKGIYTLAAYMVVVGPVLAFSRERNATIHLFISLHANPARPLISRYVTHSARRALCEASSAIDPESLLSLSEASLKMTATKHPLINHAAFSRP